MSAYILRYPLKNKAIISSLQRFHIRLIALKFDNTRRLWSCLA